VGEGTNGRKVEQPFRVRLRFAGKRCKLGKAGAEQQERESALAEPVHRDDEGAQVLPVEVLQFVDEQHEAHSFVPSGAGHRSEQRREVVLEIARVGGPGLRLHAELDVPDLGLEHARERAQHPQRARRDLPRLG
jgi:hypothetical protein